MQYNPFNKPLRDLTSDDLNLLIENQVAEGYSVEYKREFQPPIKIAKSISSFANTLGGWFFIGIEADKVNNIATRICGLDLHNISDPLSKLRDSVKSNVDPMPFFEQRLVDMGSGRAVLVVEIPDNQETPFITRDGRIYRRVNDSSDPIPEDNRYAIDRLVDHGKEVSKQFEEFCTDQRTFSKAEEKNGWVNVFLSPYPLGTIDKFVPASADEIDKLLQMSKKQIIMYDEEKKVVLASSSIPFNSGQTGVFSTILRQVEPSLIAFNSLTIELFKDGRAKLSVPLKYFPDLLHKDSNQIKSIQVREALSSIFSYRYGSFSFISAFL